MKIRTMGMRWKNEALADDTDTEFIPHLGISVPQRNWLREAFTYSLGEVHCIFPMYSEQYGWFDCAQMDEIQIHHILPKGYAYNVCQENPDNNPYNFAPICKTHHIGTNRYRGEIDHHNYVVPILHPDAEWARRHYKGTTHPTSYDKVMMGRRIRIAEGKSYWNEDYDQYLAQRSRELIDNYLIAHHNYVYPTRR